MPGSRESEIKSLLPELLKAAKLMKDENPDLVFNISLANNQQLDWVN